MKIKNKYGHCEYSIDNQTAQIDGLRIKKEYRGNGYGWNLLEATIRQIKSQLSGTLSIVAEPDDEDNLSLSIQFYEDMGFEVLDVPSSSVIMEMDI